MNLVEPYVIAVPDDILLRIQDGLKASEITYAVPGGGWDYGVDIDYLKDFFAHWRDAYDWRAWEARLNRFAHFSTRIDGMDIRFQHIRSAGGRGPIVLTHGWPGSILEFDEAAERLAFPERFGGRAEDGFDLIIPSLPGFGFSSRPERPIGPRRVAEIWATLLFERLGLTRVFLQGGDFGSPVSNFLAQDHPDKVAGLHLNLCIPMAVSADRLVEGEAEWRAAYEAVQRRESAYMLEHMTKPQTIGAALASSPVAWAAWAIEKFHGWSGRPANLDERFSKDQITTNLMIFLVNDAVTSSIWMYGGTAAEAARGLLGELRVEAPTAVALYPDEFLPAAPEAAMARHWNLQRVTRPAAGGHFAAMQEPEIFSNDVRSFFLPLDNRP